MEDYQKRVIKEKEDLDIKVAALQKFIENPPEEVNISQFEKQDLDQQLNAMKHYQLTLQSRINRF